MASLLVLSLVPTATAQSEAQTRPIPTARVRVVPRNRPAITPPVDRVSPVEVSTGVTVNVSGTRYAIPLDSRVSTWRIDSIVTLAAAARRDTTYLLLDVSGRSRGNDGSGQCGAGTEGDIVWLKLAQGRVREVRTAPYASCWRDLGRLDDGPAYKRDRDSLWSDVWIRPPHGVRFRYDFGRPASGLMTMLDTARADSLPRYPRALASAGLGGHVTARITPKGGAAPDSVDIARASHPLLAESVAEALSRWRIQAWSDTSRAPVRVEVDFVMRAAAECRVVPTPGWMRLPGARASLSSRARDRAVRVRVESCPP